MAILNSSSADHRGFTLIGTVIAVFIIALVSIAITGLLGRTAKVSGLAQEKLVAVSLAREGLELVRVLRDNNWFNNDEENWLSGLCNIASGVNPVIIDTKMIREGTPPQPATSANQHLFVDSSTGEWTHDPTRGTPASNNLTRRVTIDCRQADDEVILVTANVTWERANVSTTLPQEIDISEKFTNWLPVGRKVGATPTPEPAPDASPTPTL